MPQPVRLCLSLTIDRRQGAVISSSWSSAGCWGGEFSHCFASSQVFVQLDKCGYRYYGPTHLTLSTWSAGKYLAVSTFNNSSSWVGGVEVDHLNHLGSVSRTSESRDDEEAGLREECKSYCNCKWAVIIFELQADEGQASFLLNWNKTDGLGRAGPVAGLVVIRSTVCSHWTTLPLRPVHCPFPSSHPASQPLPATHWASRPNYSDQSYNWDQPVPTPPPPTSSQHWQGYPHSRR